MIHFRSLLGVVLALFCAFCLREPRPAHAYEFKNARAKLLADEARQSLALQAQGADSEILKGSIEGIHRIFKALPRSEVPAEDLLELRFLLQHWRRSISERALQGALSARTEADFLAWIKDLRLLRIRMKTQELFDLSEHWKMAGFAGIQGESPFLLFLAEQGDLEIQKSPFFRAAGPALLRQSGPAVLPKIQPIHDDHLPFEKWAKDPEVSRYEFDGEAVIFRGNRFQPGDFFLADLREDAPGLYSFFEVPRSILSHFAFFAVIRGVPIVVEIFEHGIRAVPLAVFLSPQFTTYVEVYRLHSVPPQWSKKFQEVLPPIWNEPHAYGFNPINQDPKYQTCSSVGSLILKRTGVEPLEPRSEVDPFKVINLKRVGFDLGRFISPTDYMLDSRVELVGWVDNNHLNKNVVDDLVLRKFGDLLSKAELRPERFPWMYSITRWAVGMIQGGSFLGKLLLPVVGFTEDSFPDAAKDALAFVDMSDGAVKKAIEVVQEKKLVGDFAKGEPLSIHDLENNPELNLKLDPAVGPIREWFLERPNQRK